MEWWLIAVIVVVAAPIVLFAIVYVWAWADWMRRGSD